MAQGIKWPVKTREIHNVVFDSSVWNDFKFRSDDIVIATWAKSGTTWTQQIIAQLLFAGEERLPVADMSPWLDPPCAAQGGEVTDDRGADSSAVYQDAFAC